MKNDYYENKMRVYENVNDARIIPGCYVVARIDGRNFSTLTRKTLKLEPYNSTMTEAMKETTKHLMNMGFVTVFGYTQSDEMSILLSPIHDNFAGKIRKINSIFAGEASAFFSLKMGIHASFDCRTIQLPNKELLVDYFNWRVNDAEKNCLSMWCWYLLRTKEGLSTEQAQKAMNKKWYDWKNEKLFEHGINFNDLPETMKRGHNAIWTTYNKVAINQLTKKEVTVSRNKIELVPVPKGRKEYGEYILALLDNHYKRFEKKL